MSLDEGLTAKQLSEVKFGRNRFLRVAGAALTGAAVGVFGGRPAVAGPVEFVSCSGTPCASCCGGAPCNITGFVPRVQACASIAGALTPCWVSCDPVARKLSLCCEYAPVNDPLGPPCLCERTILSNVNTCGPT